MKGSIHYQSDRNRWRVVWYDNKIHKHHYIHKYNGNYMPCTAFIMKNSQIVLDHKGKATPDKARCQGYKLAQKLLALIQGRYEQSQRGECAFQIEEFTKSNWTDVIDYYQKWITEVIQPKRKPATISAYKSYLKNWIKPFFTNHPIRLHEVELDSLYAFLNFIIDGLEKNSYSSNPKTKIVLKLHKKFPKLKSPGLRKKIIEENNVTISERWIRDILAENQKAGPKDTSKKNNTGKTALNIMSSLHAMMDYAHRSNRIPSVPPFPKREDYNLKGKDIDYLSPEDFQTVFNKIPNEHKPIFKWLQLHFRRPGEACALYKTDYEPINGYFKIQRAISDRKIVDSVKTNWKNPVIHRIPCDPEFFAIANLLLSQNVDSPYLFVNPRARKEDGRYTLESLRNIWYKACNDSGIRRIWTYRGVKHTACMEFLENGGTGDELMIMTDHANRKSVDSYIEITLHRKKLAMKNAKKRKVDAEASKAQRCQDVANIIPLFK